MTILYTPIDIEFDLPNEQEFIDWFEQHKVVDTDYWEYTENRHTMCFIALRYNAEDWKRYSVWQEWRTNPKVTDAGLYFHPGFEERFSSLVNAIKSLPFKQIGVAGILNQIGNVSAHIDTSKQETEIEPQRYMFFLSDPDENTFYLYHNETKIFPQVDSKYRCVAFNNTECEHGANVPKGRKMILTISGIIDEDRHKELITRSITKFANTVIRV